MSLIYILCPPEVYKAASEKGIYAVESLQSEGFIHASPANQLTRVANKYYSQHPELCIMAIDPAKIKAELKWEPIANGDLYPHLYGPLNMDAVIRTTSVSRVSDDRYEIEVSEVH